jgi:hypothetical protein
VLEEHPDGILVKAPAGTAPPGANILAMTTIPTQRSTGVRADGSFELLFQKVESGSLITVLMQSWGGGTASEVFQAP